MKKILFSLVAVVPLLFAQSVSAASPVSQKLAQMTPEATPNPNAPVPTTPDNAPAPAPTTPDNVPAPTPESSPAPQSAPLQESTPKPESAPGNVEFKQENTSTNAGEGTFGRVYDVVGDVVTIELENGGTKQIAVSKGERGTLGHLIGQRVIVDGNSFRRVALAPSVVAATSTANASRTETTTTQQTIQQEATQVEQQPAPAPAPAPVPEAAPAPGRVIPQTW